MARSGPRPCLPLLALSALALLPALATAQAAGDPVRLVLVEVADPAGEARLAGLDLDVAARVAGGLHVLADAADLAALAAADLAHSVLVEDLSAYYRARLLPPGAPLAAVAGWGGTVSPAFGQGAMGGYYTYAQIVSILDQLRAQQPALLSAKTSLGTSIEGRTLWAARLSDDPDADGPEPEVRFDALHHAREPQGMQTLLWFVLWALDQYGSDPLATYLVNEREIWCLPCVNPDGYVYNQTTNPGGGGLWRKNRRNNGGGVFGVDLNRNYPYQWGFDSFGSSGDPSSEIYRGSAPASEPEVLAMVSFLAARDFRTALSIHTYSDLWLSPWGYDALVPVNQAAYSEIANLATEVNDYPFGPASILLYAANGVTVDHDHGTHGTLSWTPEIGSASDGFWPPTNRIVPLAEENLLALQRTALAAGAWVRVPLIAAAPQGGDGDGQLDAGETLAVTVQLRNSGVLAPTTTVTATLTSGSPWVMLVDGVHDYGALPSFTSANNASAPLLLAAASGTPAGTTIEYTVHVTYEGWTQSFPQQAVVVGSPWVDLGGGAPGSAGTPHLAGEGTLAGGTPFGLALTQAPPGTLALLLIATSSAPLPVFGGTLHAIPIASELLLGTDGTGSLAGSTIWPLGFSAGTPIWFQFLVADGSVPAGITLSNALKGTTP